MKKVKSTDDALEIIHNRYCKDRPDRLADLAREQTNLDIGQKIYDLRKKAGLTQKQLAERVGTTASVISRLESADYQGHSLTMLQRIADALDKRLEIKILPRKK